jgi:predicted negative regulator of RcsB-dependent stress response
VRHAPGEHCKFIDEGHEREPVDTRTRHALKKNTFAEAAAGGVSWLSGHRSDFMRWVVSVVVIVALCIGALIYWNVRATAADKALGAALDVYTSTLVSAGATATQGEYTTAEARSKEANREFVAIAHNFSWLPQGTKARYFAGVTYVELGQTGPAETELKAVAGSWNRDLANLAKLALAGLYHQTSRDNEAIALYEALASKPSTTVSAAVAQLDLASLYADQGKMDQARALWGKVKDADKDGEAGSLAAQKLAAK